MNIFEKRPLALILCVMLSGFSLFILCSPLIRAVLIASSISLIIFAFTIKRRDTLIKIVSIGLLISFIASFLYFEVAFYPNDLYEEEKEFTAKVIDTNGYENGYQSITVKTKTVDSQKRTIKLNVNVYGVYYEITPGSIITFNATLDALENNEGFNFKKYYTSRGICASADITNLELESIEKAPISYKCKQIREKISVRAENLSNKKAGSMLSALLLGERDRLSGQLNLDFARTGITHILALSGTHVVLLAAAVDKILSIFRIGKKYRLVSGAFFTFLFMALTGFPLSVCRAGIMLILSTILFMITGCKDSVTSLAMASALIIAVTPYASQDVGLWLSILATGGILIAGEVLNENYSYETGVKRFYRAVSLSFIFSLFAISATIIVSTLSFTGTSVFAALATFIFSILTEFYVYIGIAVLLIGNVIPLGKILIIFEGLISKLVGMLSDMPISYSSTEFPLVQLIFIILGISFAIFALAPIRHKKIFLTYISILFVFANILPIGMTNQVKAKNDLAFVSEQYDRILIRTNKEASLIDISNSSKNSAYANNYFLIKENITYLDYYIVMNYYESLPQSLDKFLSSNLVSEVKLPMPRSDSESQIAISSYAIIENYRTKLSFYEDDLGATISGSEILIPYRCDNLTAILLKQNDQIYTYLSKGMLEYEPKSENLLFVSDHIVFGNYGKRYSTPKRIDEFDKRLKTVISFDADVDFNTSASTWQPPKLYFLQKTGFSFYQRSD